MVMAAGEPASVTTRTTEVSRAGRWAVTALIAAPSTPGARKASAVSSPNVISSPATNPHPDLAFSCAPTWWGRPSMRRPTPSQPPSR